jgi:hypothetical protein
MRNKLEGLFKASIYSSAYAKTFIIQWLGGKFDHVMEQYPLKIVNNCLNSNIYSYLETSGGQNSTLYLNVVHFFNTSVN